MIKRILNWADIETISGLAKSFAALKVAKNVVTWGDPTYGGDSSTVSNELFGTDEASFALKGDGSLVGWGNLPSGYLSLDASVTDGTNPIEAVYTTGTSMVIVHVDGTYNYIP